MSRLSPGLCPENPGISLPLWVEEVDGCLIFHIELGAPPGGDNYRNGNRVSKTPSMNSQLSAFVEYLSNPNKLSVTILCLHTHEKK